MPGLRVFGAPLRYVQGPGALDSLGEIVRTRHERAVVLIDALLVDALAGRVTASLAGAGVAASVLAASGEVTQARIDAEAEVARAFNPTVIVAIGGGKTLDTGKGIARSLGARMITVPTIASNDGPTSRVIALYDEAHRLVDTPRMDENPEAVVVDTQLISEAPTHFLVAGIGDAAAKRFEAAACARGTGMTSNGTRPLELAGVIADECYRLLVQDAREALVSAERNEVSPALERVIEAVILMSGLAFENGGLSLAHSMTRGLLELSDVKSRLHGYHVAYGLLVQLMHEGDVESFRSTRAFFQATGLPVALRDMGQPLSAASADVVVQATLGAPHLANCVPVPTAISLAAAMNSVELGTG
jgi:glycerol dehydrogenase